MRRLWILIAILVLAMSKYWTIPSQAQSFALPTTFPTQSQIVTPQLVMEQKAIQPGQPFWVGIHMQIPEHWHTYWQNPGDSGAATQVDWTLPSGFEAGPLQWPYPERLPVGPLMNFGYEDEVMLLTQMTPPQSLDPSQPVTLQADVRWLVCLEECLPESATLKLKIPVLLGDPLPNLNWSAAFEETRQAFPMESPWLASFELNETTLDLILPVPNLAADRIKSVAFFPYEDGLITNAADQQLVISPDGLVLTLERGYQPDFEALKGVIVITEDLDNTLGVQAFTIDTTEPDVAQPILQILGLALLGGIILNLMPCVFPVLSLKALNIVQQAQHNPGRVRLQSLVFTAGILVSVGILGGVLFGLKAMGLQIGWGFQLQSPGFVLILIYLLFAVGLSLSGVFIVGAAWMGVGQKLTMQSGYLGDFFTGVLATVVATPCTAPFMATAIGVALTQPPVIALAILETLGFGLALPYLIIGFTPSLQQHLPKPGAWMETLQQLLAFPIYGAAAWLLWVLTLQTGTTGLALGLSGIILIAFAIWSYQKTRQFHRFWRRLGLILTLVSLTISLAWVPLISTQTVTPATSTVAAANSTSGIDWEPYSAARLAELKSKETPTFLSFSAAWCISCLVNEQIVFSQPEVIQSFAEKEVAVLKGDWTHYDPTITTALNQFGRSGVPLYVFYTDLASDPVILPQILTPNTVLDLLDQLS